jgi:hypothetical protein
MLKFNKLHGSSFLENHFNVGADCKELMTVNTRILAGGASQSFSVFKLLENIIITEKIEYVVEIGSQKGGLSVYLGTTACVSEQFLFHTFELNKTAWYKREDEGAGHWFEKMETICPYCKSFEMDIFSEQAFNIIQDNINKYKTLIICDGGNKPLEIATYSQILESGDIIMPHDFGIEIDDHNIDKNIVEEYQPWSDRFISSGTTFKVFKKK